MPAMAIETTYTEARSQLATYLDRVVDDQEVVIVNRRGKEPAAIISAAELSSLMETAHLMRSPRNAQRLLSALAKARAGKGVRLTVDQLRKRFGLGEE
jgi:antitoxin YefM